MMFFDIGEDHIDQIGELQTILNDICQQISFILRLPERHGCHVAARSSAGRNVDAENAVTFLNGTDLALIVRFHPLRMDDVTALRNGRLLVLCLKDVGTLGFTLPIQKYLIYPSPIDQLTFLAKIHVALFRARHVCLVRKRLSWNDKPDHIRSDNGPELIAASLQEWLTKVGIKPIQIYPGSPWENGYNERFNGTLRREILNAEWFHTTEQAQVAINIWLRQYNKIRPHHALNMRPPVPETITEKPKISGPDQGG